MRRFFLLFAFLPFIASAMAISGVDDKETKIPAELQKKLNRTFLTYYQNPSVAKVNTILDIMNNDEVLIKKTAWPVFVGFFTVVFADNKNHVISWITRNDYNTYAQDVMISALMHAKLKESALVFAQAQQWKKEDIDRIRDIEDDTDLKRQKMILPGHIDTLWGAFFASGDVIYLQKIINVLFMKSLPQSDTVYAPGHKPEDVLAENKRLAETSIRTYAMDDALIRDTIKKRIIEEKISSRKEKLESLLPTMSFPVVKP